MSRHRTYPPKEKTDTSMACTNKVKSKVLSLKQIGERYNETIFRILTEYESLIPLKTVTNEIQR